MIGNYKGKNLGMNLLSQELFGAEFLAHHWVQIKGKFSNVQSFTRTNELSLGCFQCILMHFMLGFLDVFFGVTERAKEMQMIMRRC